MKQSVPTGLAYPATERFGKAGFCFPFRLPTDHPAVQEVQSPLIVIPASSESDRIGEQRENVGMEEERESALVIVVDVSPSAWWRPGAPASITSAAGSLDLGGALDQSALGARVR